MWVTRIPWSNKLERNLHLPLVESEYINILKTLRNHVGFKKQQKKKAHFCLTYLPTYLSTVHFVLFSTVYLLTVFWVIAHEAHFSVHMLVWSGLPLTISALLIAHPPFLQPAIVTWCLAESLGGNIQIFSSFIHTFI